MNYIFAILILGGRFTVQTLMQWSHDHKVEVNLIYSIGTFLILMAVYWVPFWLIFFK